MGCVTFFPTSLPYFCFTRPPPFLTSSTDFFFLIFLRPCYGTRSAADFFFRNGAASCKQSLSCLGMLDRGYPHIDIHLHHAHTLKHMANPPVCGGGTTASVVQAVCAVAWPQCWGNGPKRGKIGAKMERGEGKEKTQLAVGAKEWEHQEEEERRDGDATSTKQVQWEQR